MDKKYIIDIKKNNNSNDFILNVSNIGKLKSLDLDINNCLINYKKALNKDDLGKASEILSVLKELTEYGDKRFSDGRILFKIKEITLLYKNIDTKNVIDSMNILLKIKSFFRFLNSQITFEYNDENTNLIEKIKIIRDSIKIKELIDTSLYKNYNPSIRDLEIVLQFKENFNTNKEDIYLEEFYNFFYEKINKEIRTLNIITSKYKINKYKNIFSDKYNNNFYESEEFKNLLTRNTTDTYKDFSILADKYYLIYQYNNATIDKEKNSILARLLLGNLINVPKIYRGIIIENIIKGKKQYVEIDSLYDDINRNLEIIKEEKRLNAIVI